MLTIQSNTNDFITHIFTSVKNSYTFEWKRKSQDSRHVSLVISSRVKSALPSDTGTNSRKV